VAKAQDLAPVLHALIRASAESAQFEDNMRAMREAARAPRVMPNKVAALLRVLQSPTRDEAATPAGLAVQLRPYQRQALKFMLDAEEKVRVCVARMGKPPLPVNACACVCVCVLRRTQGMRRFFWSKLTTPNGTSLWYHLRTDVLTHEEPPELRGGWLCEDMVRACVSLRARPQAALSTYCPARTFTQGLGKTVITVALLLAAAPTAAERAAAAAAALPGAGKPTVTNRAKSCATLVVCPVSLVGQARARARANLHANGGRAGP